MSNTTAPFDAAQALAKQGCSVFPLKPRDKVPHGLLLPKDADGKRTWTPFQKQRADDAQISTWKQQCPDANVAIVTGAISGVVVLDIDGPDGEANVASLGALPYTPTAMTGKGRHVYFAHPGGNVPNFARKLPGLDLRGDGGYVVAPPSVHPSGRNYEWLITPDVPFAPLPAWLCDLITPPAAPQPTPPPAMQPAPQHVDARRDAYVRKVYVEEVDRLARALPGIRNDTLNHVAFRLGQLIGSGDLQRSTVETVLLATAQGIGLGTHEARQTVRSGIDAGMKQPEQFTALRTSQHTPQPQPANSQSTQQQNQQSAAAPQQNQNTQQNQQPQPQAQPTTPAKKDDLDFALAFTHQHHTNWVYHEPAKQWYHYPGTHWAAQDADSSVLQRRVQDVIRAEAPSARITAARLTSVIKIAQAHCSSNLGQHADLVNFANGTLDVGANTLRAHDRADELLYCLPYAYPARGYDESQHPNITAFLQATIPDLIAQHAYITHIGLALLGDTLLHIVCLLYGPPRSGKSTLLKLANATCGIALASMAGPSLFGRDTEGKRSRARFNQHRIVCVDELPVEALRGEEIFKSMTAHSGVEMRSMHKDEEMNNQWLPKLLLSTNEAPHYKDTTGAMQRRLIILEAPNEQSESKINPHLLDTLLPELGAFAATCIAYAQVALQKGAYPQSQAMRALLQQISREGNPLRMFVEDMCILHPHATIPTADFRQEYEAFCKTNGNIPLSDNKLTSALTEMHRGIVRGKSNGVRLYKGIRLRNAGDPL